MPFSKTYYYLAAVLFRTAVFLLKPDFTHNANDIPIKQTFTPQSKTLHLKRAAATAGNKKNPSQK